MYLYNKNEKQLSKIEVTSFKEHQIRERQDLEKWIIENPAFLGEELYIVTSEYDKFDKTNERLDILAVDHAGKLVVIELKLDDSGRDVEIQAIKYASYVSQLLLADIVKIRARPHNKTEEFIEKEIRDFIDGDFEDFDGDVRIIIVAKEFRPEITTAVLWLRNYGLKIDCVKITLFDIDSEKIGLLPQTIIPLPEIADYQIRAEEREGKKRLSKRRLEYLELYTELRDRFQGLTSLDMDTPAPQSYYQIKTTINGVHYEWGFHGNPRSSFGVELHFESGRKENLQLFSRLKQQKEQIEKQIGQELVWEDLWRSKNCKIVLELNQGYIDEQLKQWAVENMKRLIDTFQPLLDSFE